MNTALAYETRTESAHHARADRFAELDELSFAELLSLEDDLSEGSQWSLLDDVRGEIAERRDDAAEALRTLFILQATFGGELPMVEGGKVVQWLSTRYLTEAVGANNWAPLVADILVGYGNRDALIERMAEEYATEQAEDLLRAGWSAEQ